jgi:hypothetical protein
MERKLNSLTVEGTPILYLSQIHKVEPSKLIRQKIDIRLLVIEISC